MQYLNSKMIGKFFFFSLSAFLLPHSVNADDSVGKSIFEQGISGTAVMPCSSCHGTVGEGEATSGTPALGGLQPVYVAETLKSFKSGERKNALMDSIAAELSIKQIEAVAEYIGTLPRPKPSLIKSPVLVEKGRILFEYGKRLSAREWIPSCDLCHGFKAQGSGDMFPMLANQNANYLVEQLQNFKTGKRKDMTEDLMKSIAVKLSNEDINAVAAYLSSKSIAKEYAWPYLPRGEYNKKDNR